MSTKYDGHWSYCLKTGQGITRRYIERVAQRHPEIEVDFRMPLTSEIKEGYQVLTFGYLVRR